MLCEECKKKPATVHLTKVINGERVEARLCSECAREVGEFPSFAGFDGSPFAASFSLPQLLAGMLSGVGMVSDARPETEVDTGVKCDCGLSYRDFAGGGRLGCTKCYSTFGEQLSPLLRRIHGNSRHVGKVPAKSGGIAKLRRDIEDLRGELKELISQERYEDAASVRDKVRELEKQLECGPTVEEGGSY